MDGRHFLLLFLFLRGLILLFIRCFLFLLRLLRLLITNLVGRSTNQLILAQLLELSGHICLLLEVLDVILHTCLLGNSGEELANLGSSHLVKVLKHLRIVQLINRHLCLRALAIARRARRRLAPALLLLNAAIPVGN